MSNLLNSLINSAKKAEISSGIHENCVITEVNVGNKKNKNGELVNRNCYTKFVKLDKDNKPVGEKEISWFNLDYQSEYVKDNFVTQIFQLVNILECYYTAEEVNEIFDTIFKEFEITDEDSLNEVLTDKENCKNLMTDISKAYVEHMTEVCGVDSEKLRLKLSFDSKGKYIQQPKFGEIVEKLSVEKENSKLKFSKTEQDYEQKAMNLSTNTEGNSNKPKIANI